MLILRIFIEPISWTSERLLLGTFLFVLLGFDSLLISPLSSLFLFFENFLKNSVMIKLRDFFISESKILINFRLNLSNGLRDLIDTGWWINANISKVLKNLDSKEYLVWRSQVVGWFRLFGLLLVILWSRLDWFFLLKNFHSVDFFNLLFLFLWFFGFLRSDSILLAFEVKNYLLALFNLVSIKGQKLVFLFLNDSFELFLSLFILLFFLIFPLKISL